ncbi:hypothetical protein [Paraburkholderia acidisoli]|uniref:Uncharacterized protein n=1 Tax=Paraburkholderia acidisoli TaxID=2571748 RepID=A0A7Z2GPI7_9BURK|nr:hypothetical protein [Paraburkholderia acidisoli]QGZ65350.1 hypothetical protein FAZ98_26650 [Paraburkholderia acidisoli]
MRAFALTAAVFVLSSALLTNAAHAQTATLAYTASPAADKVYPPLPSLAMLPPTAGDEDTLPAPHAGARKKKVKAHLDCRCSAPAPRLVVSDASRAYLKDIEKQIDVALAR